MGKGFVGRAANGYFESVNNTLQNSQNTLGEFRKDHFLSQSSKILPMNTIGNSQTNEIVSITDEKFDYVLNQIFQIEKSNQENFSYVIDVIRQLCAEDFRIPSVNPKIETNLNQLENNLDEFFGVTEIVTSFAKKFMEEINVIDK